MKTINIEKQHHVALTLFPDNQPHVRLVNVAHNEPVSVVCSLRSSLDVLNLLQVSNAIDNVGAIKVSLKIKYLLGARYDRAMLDGDSVDLKVIADLVNTTQFPEVQILDPHSDAALNWIKNSSAVGNAFLLTQYTQPDAVLICPDAGAAKKLDGYLKYLSTAKEIVYCLKKRDLATGKIDLKVFEPEKCKGRNCVVVDDICDGGATFGAIASQIQPAHLSLIVTHGIFSKGFASLERDFQEIIVSDSLQSSFDSKIVKTIPTPFV